MLKRFSVAPKHFVVEEAGTVEIGFDLGSPSEVEVQIRDEANYVVRKLALGPRNPGRIRVVWDGLDDEGRRLYSQVYLFLVQARGRDGGVTVYGGSAVGAADELMVQRFMVDGETGGISYVMPRAGRVRLRVGLVGYPILRTITDWQPQPAGRHEVEWDGRDQSGLIDLRGHPKLQLRLHAFELPRNSVILQRGGAAPGRRADGTLPLDRGFRHARHQAHDCHEPSFDVELVGVDRADEQGRPILLGGEIVRVTISPEDEAHLINARFETMLFLDTTFIFEEEEGSNPFNYRLDEALLTPGLHLLTVNVLSYDDHAGVVTVPFVVEEM